VARRIRVLLWLLSVGVVVAAAIATESGRDPDAVRRFYEWSRPDGALRVAWLGNVHTFHHQVPYQIQAMAHADARALWFETIATPASTLRRHRELGDFERLLRSPFDVVVLQEQSTRSHFEQPEFGRDAAYFAGLAHAVDARVVLVEAWSYGPEMPLEGWSEARAASVQAETSAYIDALAEALHARVAPVGRAFAVAQRTPALPPVIGPDGNKSTPEGAFLMAAVVYLTIVDGGTSATPVVSEAGVPPDVQRRLWEIASRTTGRRAPASIAP
jgi:hypothetical protein